MNRFFLLLFTAIAIIFLTNSQTWSTTVAVYAEVGYTDTKFTLKIYANIASTDQDDLVSAGVNVLYPTAKLEHPVAIKNEKEWYFGTPQIMYSYIEPNESSAGEITILLGKFDQNNPQAGVAGDRILLCQIDFDRIPSKSIPVQSDFVLSAGKEAPFVNFATVNGNGLDSFVTFSISPVVSTASLKMRDIIRILQIVSGMSTDVPVRATEIDGDNDGVVGLGEAIALMKEATQ